MNIPITAPFGVANGAATASGQTRFSIGFEALLTTFAEFVEAEADLDFINHNNDPSLSFWSRDRDVAEARLTDCLANLHQQPVLHPEDRPLHRFVLLLTAMLDDEEPTYPRQLRRQMKASFVTHYQVCGFGPRATYRNALLAQAWQLTDAMVKLSRFDFLPDCALAPPIVDEPDGFPSLDF